MLVASIIIPVYNDSERLKKCLEALKLQTIVTDKFEVIVVDNNSEQDILDVVTEFGGPNCVYAKEARVGSYAARNKGLQLAKSEVIVFTDSDCIPQADWLENGIMCLTNTENPGVIGGRIELIYDAKKLSYVEIYEKHTAFSPKG